MAYPTYPYPGYQPTPYYPGPVPDQLAQLRQNQAMQNMPQPMPQPAPVQYQQPMFAPQPFPYSCEVIWISSEKEAEDYIVAKNSAVALWDRKNAVLYLKETDASGQPHMDIYDLSRRGDEQAAPSQKLPQIDLSGYVTWDKLEDYLSERLKKPARAAKQKEDEQQ